LGKSECRMPNAETNPKSEARSQRRSIGTLGSPREHPESPRRHLPPAARGGWEAILRILDLGILSDFDFRNSDFMTPNLWISIMRGAAISSNLLASFFLRGKVWDMRAFLKASLYLLAFFFLIRPLPAMAADVPAKSDKPNHYDTQENRNQQIGFAIKTATAENKRIILKFGANW
jgi:hypothetical protein